jgi:large subunit ribosomal protein L1
VTSNRLKKIYQTFNNQDFYQLNDALILIKKNATSKFDETIDIVFGLNLNKQSKPIREMVSLPAGIGKLVRVAVFAKGDKYEEAIEANADIVGADDLINDISSGKINFDICIATPDMMQMVSKVAKILGPKGLMPNPKLGTVTTNIKNSIKTAKQGQVELKADKNGLVHSLIGKASFDVDQLKQNFDSVLNSLNLAKPSDVKDRYINYITISSTMGPSVKVSLSNLEI